MKKVVGLDNSSRSVSWLMCLGDRWFGSSLGLQYQYNMISVDTGPGAKFTGSCRGFY